LIGSNFSFSSSMGVEEEEEEDGGKKSAEEHSMRKS
jgi:hypothetical protein